MCACVCGIMLVLGKVGVCIGLGSQRSAHTRTYTYTKYMYKHTQNYICIGVSALR